MVVFGFNVRSGPGFTAEENRLNVTLTRQKSGLLLVGDMMATGPLVTKSVKKGRKVVRGKGLDGQTTFTRSEVLQTSGHVNERLGRFEQDIGHVKERLWQIGQRLGKLESEVKDRISGCPRRDPPSRVPAPGYVHTMDLSSGPASKSFDSHPSYSITNLLFPGDRYRPRRYGGSAVP